MSRECDRAINASIMERRSVAAMSITEKVKAAEKRVLKALNALTNPDAKDTNRLCDELRKATDE